ncbi:unnamed protein product [Amoebophrya sp. A120]|nr:unnamed protein product [Amoebophrya sp. A120]|eukprot:GSA120T00009446001.1
MMASEAVSSSVRVKHEHAHERIPVPSQYVDSFDEHEPRPTSYNKRVTAPSYSQAEKVLHMHDDFQIFHPAPWQIVEAPEGARAEENKEDDIRAYMRTGMTREQAERQWHEVNDETPGRRRNKRRGRVNLHARRNGSNEGAEQTRQQLEQERPPASTSSSFMSQDSNVYPPSGNEIMVENLFEELFEREEAEEAELKRLRQERDEEKERTEKNSMSISVAANNDENKIMIAVENNVAGASSASGSAAASASGSVNYGVAAANHSTTRNCNKTVLEESTTIRSADGDVDPTESQSNIINKDGVIGMENKQEIMVENTTNPVSSKKPPVKNKFTVKKTGTEQLERLLFGDDDEDDGTSPAGMMNAEDQRCNSVSASSHEQNLILHSARAPANGDALVPAAPLIPVSTNNNFRTYNQGKDDDDDDELFDQIDKLKRQEVAESKQNKNLPGGQHGAFLGGTASCFTTSFPPGARGQTAQPFQFNQPLPGQNMAPQRSRNVLTDEEARQKQAELVAEASRGKQPQVEVHPIAGATTGDITSCGNRTGADPKQILISSSPSPCRHDPVALQDALRPQGVVGAQAQQEQQSSHDVFMQPQPGSGCAAAPAVVMSENNNLIQHDVDLQKRLSESQNANPYAGVLTVAAVPADTAASQPLPGDIARSSVAGSRVSATNNNPYSNGNFNNTHSGNVNQTTRLPDQPACFNPSRSQGGASNDSNDFMGKVGGIVTGLAGAVPVPVGSGMNKGTNDMALNTTTMTGAAQFGGGNTAAHVGMRMFASASAAAGPGHHNFPHTMQGPPAFNTPSNGMMLPQQNQQQQNQQQQQQAVLFGSGFLNNSSGIAPHQHNPGSFGGFQQSGSFSFPTNQFQFAHAQGQQQQRQQQQYQAAPQLGQQHQVDVQGHHQQMHGQLQQMHGQGGHQMQGQQLHQGAQAAHFPQLPQQQQQEHVNTGGQFGAAAQHQPQLGQAQQAFAAQQPGSSQPPNPLPPVSQFVSCTSGNQQFAFGSTFGTGAPRAPANQGGFFGAAGTTGFGGSGTTSNFCVRPGPYGAGGAAAPAGFRAPGMTTGVAAPAGGGSKSVVSFAQSSMAGSTSSAFPSIAEVAQQLQLQPYSLADARVPRDTMAVQLVCAGDYLAARRAIEHILRWPVVSCVCLAADDAEEAAIRAQIQNADRERASATGGSATSQALNDFWTKTTHIERIDFRQLLTTQQSGEQQEGTSSTPTSSSCAQIFEQIRKITEEDSVLSQHATCFLDCMPPQNVYHVARLLVVSDPISATSQHETTKLPFVLQGMERDRAVAPSRRLAIQRNLLQIVDQLHLQQFVSCSGQRLHFLPGSNLGVLFSSSLGNLLAAKANSRACRGGRGYFTNFGKTGAGPIPLPEPGMTQNLGDSGFLPSGMSPGEDVPPLEHLAAVLQMLLQ